jgi:hypothetical protein
VSRTFLVVKKLKMNKCDRKLLDKQLRGYTPPRKDGVMILTLVAVFLAGVTVGGMLFPRRSDPTRNTPSEATVISLMDSVPSKAAMVSRRSN